MLFSWRSQAIALTRRDLSLRKSIERNWQVHGLNMDWDLHGYGPQHGDDHRLLGQVQRAPPKLGERYNCRTGPTSSLGNSFRLPGTSNSCLVRSYREGYTARYGRGPKRAFSWRFSGSRRRPLPSFESRARNGTAALFLAKVFRIFGTPTSNTYTPRTLW